MGVDKDYLSVYKDLFKTLYFRLSLWLFYTWICISVPDFTELEGSNLASLVYAHRCSSCSNEMNSFKFISCKLNSCEKGLLNHQAY